jgi:hypothetical protein
MNIHYCIKLISTNLDEYNIQIGRFKFFSESIILVISRNDCKLNQRIFIQQINCFKENTVKITQHTKNAYSQTITNEHYIARHTANSYSQEVLTMLITNGIMEPYNKDLIVSNKILLQLI